MLDPSRSDMVDLVHSYVLSTIRSCNVEKKFFLCYRFNRGRIYSIALGPSTKLCSFSEKHGWGRIVSRISMLDFPRNETRS